MKETRYIISNGYLGGTIVVDEHDMRPGRTTTVVPPPTQAGKLITWVGNEWVYIDRPIRVPPIPQPHDIDTDYFFASILSAGEMEALLAARKTDPVLDRLLYLLERKEIIRLEGPVVVELLTHMETLAIIDATRRNDIDALATRPESRSRRPER